MTDDYNTELPDTPDSIAVALHDDIHEAIRRIDAVHSDLQILADRLEALIKSHNQVGESVAWLTANTQGLFQMFNDPSMMNQMMGMVMGGIGGGKPNPSP